MDGRRGGRFAGRPLEIYDRSPIRPRSSIFSGLSSATTRAAILISLTVSRDFRPLSSCSGRFCKSWKMIQKTINIKEGVRKLIWFFKGEDEGEAEDNAISDFSRPMLLTRAALDDDCQAFEKIILTGKTDPAAGDNYSKNYRFIQKFINEKAESNPKEFRSFIGNLRRKTCFLTVTTENRALALRVFNTLNQSRSASVGCRYFQIRHLRPPRGRGRTKSLY